MSEFPALSREGLSGTARNMTFLVIYYLKKFVALFCCKIVIWIVRCIGSQHGVEKTMFHQNAHPEVCKPYSPFGGVDHEFVKIEGRGKKDPRISEFFPGVTWPGSTCPSARCQLKTSRNSSNSTSSSAPAISK